MERIQQVNQLIKEELGQIILREGGFSKNVLVTITRVETTRNLIDTKVYVSVLPETQSQIIRDPKPEDFQYPAITEQALKNEADTENHIY